MSIALQAEGRALTEAEAFARQGYALLPALIAPALPQHVRSNRPMENTA